MSDTSSSSSSQTAAGGGDGSNSSNSSGTQAKDPNSSTTSPLEQENLYDDDDDDDDDETNGSTSTFTSSSTTSGTQGSGFPSDGTKAYMRTSFAAFGRPLAPIMNPIIPDLDTWEKLIDFEPCKDKGMEGFVCAFLIILAQLEFVTSAFKSREDGEVALANLGGQVNGRDQTEGEYQHIFRGFVSNRGGMVPHIMNFLHYFKLQELDTDHITNYFASLGIEDISMPKFCKFMNSLRPFIPDVTQTIGFPYVRHDNPFTVYRETRVGWPSLLKRAINVIGPFMTTDYSGVDGRDQAAFAGMNGIDMTILAAYLDANKAFPPDWYQGLRARKDVSPSMYKTFVNMFKARNEIVAKQTDMSEVETLDDWMKKAAVVFRSR